MIIQLLHWWNVNPESSILSLSHNKINGLFLFDQDCLLTQWILHPEVKIGTGQMLGRPEDILGITTPQLCESGVIYLVLGTRGNSPISPQPPFPLTSSHRVTLAELPKLL